jgi:hypothetical protein
MASKPKATRRTRQAPRPPRQAAPPSTVPLPADIVSSLTMLVGEMRGQLVAHIEAVHQDRAERDNDRRDSAQYRKEMRETLAGLNEKIDSSADHGTRIKALEKTALDYKTFRNKAAGVVLAVGFFWTFAGSAIVDKVKKVFF